MRLWAPRGLCGRFSVCWGSEPKACTSTCPANLPLCAQPTYPRVRGQPAPMCPADLPPCARPTCPHVPGRPAPPVPVFLLTV